MAYGGDITLSDQLIDFAPLQLSQRRGDMITATQTNNNADTEIDHFLDTLFLASGTAAPHGQTISQMRENQGFHQKASGTLG